eukprot:CAMPEP_0197836166 /NCGR_PEP_ID=MMETSP1437-20131217/28152_1 /TAXON_ID=49252 ORGANISM="Eucampia antarctica, Strain CCMP1452" /NCGR_SAMPLE_ID=MMETSP1437 /ASSEMBLY_ACC=CAM_ASM_001096 /LENGTH=484 /DNA_ID=CAMNT_0043442135 /DNA_START=109 /DNA_END=1563 /DNA_ORIENTATION=+
MTINRRIFTLLAFSALATFPLVCESKAALIPSAHKHVVLPRSTLLKKSFNNGEFKKNESSGVTTRGGGGGTVTVSSEIMNLVKAIVGVGVLSLSAGVAAFGDAPGAIIPAVTLIALMGTLAGYEFSIIGRICSYTDATSYRTAWEKTVGEASSWIPAFTVTFKTFLAVLAYSMVLADTFKSLLESVGLPVSRTKSLVTVTITTLLPLCLLKNLSSLAPFSLLGIMGMLFTCAAMTVRYFGGTYAAPDGKFLSDIPENFLPKFGDLGASAVLNPKAFILLCMLSTAYICHFNAPKFYIELENNTVARFNKVVFTSFGISTVIFCIATALGFLTFGSNSSGFVLSNYSTNDTLMKISRLAVAFALIFTYPLVFVGCREGVLDLFNVQKEKRTNALLDKITFCLLTLITLAAMKVKDLSFVLAFGGATLGNALIYIFPALMFRKAIKDMGEGASDALKAEVKFTNLLGILGIVFGCIGGYMALTTIN